MFLLFDILQGMKKGIDYIAVGVVLDFKVLVDREKVKNGVPDKHSEIKWFKFNNLPKPLHSQFPFFLQKYKEKLFNFASRP